MLFNSIEFAIFLPVTLCLYWLFNGKIRSQNFVLLAASYLFYGWWDWRFLSLIFLSSVVDFMIGIHLSRTDNKIRRKVLLLTSLGLNLGMLGFFKYYNFFVDSFSQAFTLLGSTIDPSRLSIVLPVGISFYTFQTLSYTIDVYRGKIVPTSSLLNFMAFVSFFPQLVAGPIERASNLLPQFSFKRTFGEGAAILGLRQILWGLFKKVVIADNCAEIVNLIFADYSTQSASTLVLGAVLFSFQIYGDFSGYSDIAIGTSKLFGFTLMKNFNFPYFSRDIAEFWRKWHISLSTWFRDYLYIPLGGSRVSKSLQIRNTLIIFLVSGFWHGANWTFIAWGLLHSIYFLPLLLLQKNRKNLDTSAENGILPQPLEFLQILTTFMLTSFAWIFFRATSLTDAFGYISRIFDHSIFSLPTLGLGFLHTTVLIFFLIVEWIGRKQEFAIEQLRFPNTGLRWMFYYAIIFAILLLSGNQQQFIYFQF